MFQAFNYFLKACSYDYGASCFNAGMLTITGTSNPNKEKDYTKGLELLEKGCKLNITPACYYLSGLYINGSEDKVVEKNMELAFQYSEKACELGNYNFFFFLIYSTRM